MRASGAALATLCTPDATVIAPALAKKSVLAANTTRATRKPRLLFRLSGSFLLRFDERRLSGLLFQEPPRTTREDGADQAPGVSMQHH
jgi:hypothetical protein